MNILPHKRDIIFASMGFAAMVAQIVILRKLIVVFGGNELVAGAVFAGWLGSSGVGNIVVKRFADGIKDVPRALALLLFALALAIPATVILSDFVKTFAGLPPPVMPGLVFMVFAIVALLLPVGLLIGASFTIACRLPGSQTADDIGRVYALDVIGAGIGGIVFSLFAIRFFSPLETAFIISAILAASAGFSLGSRWIKVAALCIVAVLSAAILFAPAIQKLTADIKWKGYDVIAEKESLFANLMVTGNLGEQTMFVDGRPSFSLPLPETYETIAHIPFIEHRNPRDVAIAGGGISGVLNEWRKWNLHNAQFIRLDPDETDLERGVMRSNIKELPDWASIVHADARRIIKEGLPGGCRESCLDVLIINVGDPDTAAADRYFTTEFFAEAKKILRPDGVIALFLLEPANVIGEETKSILGTVAKSVEASFSNIVILPLEKFVIIGSAEPGALTDDLDELGRRLDDRRIRAETLRAFTLPGIFAEKVRSFRDEILSAAKAVALNTDLKPVAYHAGMKLWEAKSGGEKGHFLDALAKAGKFWPAVFVVLLAAGSIIFGRRKAANIGTAWALFAIGFASIAYEIILIVHYQMSEGMLVRNIGLILTAFMIGSGFGVAVAGKIFKGKKAGRGIAAASIALIACYVPLMFIVVKAGFLLANFTMGILCGLAYQTMASRIVGEGTGVGRAAGHLESFDHFGAAIGALAASIVAIPLWGLFPSLAMGTFILAIAGVVVGVSR